MLVISVVCGKSLNEIHNEFQQRHSDKFQKQREIFLQNEEVKRVFPHCQSGDNTACKKFVDLTNKSCQNGLAVACLSLAQAYLQGNEQMGIKIDENKAKSYADRVCALDATFCASMSGLFMNKNRKLALKYAEKACEMGESMGCLVAAGAYHNGDEGKVKYYGDKLCRAGLKEACH